MAEFKAGDRRISYQVWGPLTGRTFVFFHGFPGSLVQAQALGERSALLGVSVIACDRPGYGGTSPFATENDFLDGVRGILDHHGVKRFEVVGVSGGSPWAHLMAARFAGEVNALRVVCGLGPFAPATARLFPVSSRLGLQGRRLLPAWMSAPLFAVLLRPLGTERFFERLTGLLDEVDREALREPESVGMILASMAQARRQGAAGVLSDTALYARDWWSEFEIFRLSAVPVFYSHGLKDRVVAPGLSRWMHGALPQSRLQLFEAEGHYSLPLRRMSSLLEL